MKIDISKLDKAAVLASLYNNSHQQGMGFFDQRGRNEMSVTDAEQLLKDQSYFDYIYGRVIKVNLKGVEIDPWLYDRDNGDGAAQRAIDKII